jgi:beta-1,4-mannosyltransferase
MKVLFAPYSSENIYHTLLINALDNNGVEAFPGIESRYQPIFSLSRQIKNNPNIDIIHLLWTHTFFIFPTIYQSIFRFFMFLIDILIIKFYYRKKIVWTIHNKYNHEKKFLPLDKFMTFILIRIVDGIKVECAKAQSVISSMYKIKAEKIEVIPDGNYVDVYPDNITQREAREQLGIKQDAFVFTFLGQIRSYKGVENLINTFKELDLPDSRLIIAGKPISTEYKNHLITLIGASESVMSRLEFIPVSEVQLYMNSADVVVAPYKDILTSSSVWLGMAFAKPMLVPDMGCIMENLECRNNFIYSAGAGLSETLKNAYNTSKTKLIDMGQANFQKAQGFTWDQSACKTIQLYNKVINQK